MKKTSLLILLLTAAYSFLFYDEHAGLNFLLFSLIVSGSLLTLSPGASREKPVQVVAVLYLLSALCVLMYSSSLSVLANVISLLLLSAYCFNSRSTVIFNLFFSVYSVLSGPVFMIINLVRSEKGDNETGIKKSKLRSLTYIIPGIFSIIFFFLYKSANPLFEKYTKELNLDFVSISWLFFTIGGFLVAYGIIKHQRIKEIDRWENNIPTAVSLPEEKPNRWDEKKAAVILFVLLNLMLAFINLLDLNYLYLGAGMPKGVTHKQFVHNGVGMLILSISLAIVLILYFFRGRLHFDDKNKLIKILVYAWIAQNLLMVVSTTIRNNMYVSDALLTYKRIGVYYWLLMAAVGLVTTFIMIRHARSGWYLFKTNSWIAYFVLVLSGCIDWDKFIGSYNVSHSTLMASLDKKYLLAVSEANLPELYKIKEEPGFNVDSSYHYMSGYYSQPNTQLLDRKLYRYLSEMQEDSWKSFSYRKERILKELNALNAMGKINALDLSGMYLKSLQPVSFINNIKELDVSTCSISALNELACFKKLQKLNLDGNEIPSLDSLPDMKELRQLSVNDNNISEFYFIERFKFLEVLNMAGNHIQDINGFPANATIKELALGSNPIIDLTPLNRWPNLEKLELNGLPAPIEKFPSLDKLRTLELKNSENVYRTLNLMGSLRALEYLDLSNNTLKNINALMQVGNEVEIWIAKSPGLKSLNLYANQLDHINSISVFSKLEVLDLSHNKLRAGDELVQLKNLSQLFMEANLLANINFLNSLPQLRQLDLSDNTLLLDFTPLKGLSHLNELDLSETRFNDLSLISSYHLKKLDISGCRLPSLNALEKQKDLQTLSISYLRHADIGSLKNLKSLKELTISKTEYKIIQQFKKELPGVTVNGM